MTNEEAYGGIDYSARALTLYKPGDVVRIGPAYCSGGSYRNDGSEGVYTVIKRLLDTPDYYLARGVVDAPEHDRLDCWDVICHAARLIRA